MRRGENTVGLVFNVEACCSWGGNLKGEVCQGQGEEQGNKNRMALRPTLEQHSGPERALTEKVVDSVTVENCVLPPCYRCCSCSAREGGFNLQRKVCVSVCACVLFQRKHFMIHFLSFEMQIKRT